MSKLLVSAGFAGALMLAAGTAAASSGQCYNAEGRPTGPAYDLAVPDTDWIRFVIARGGRCTGFEDAADEAPPRFNAHEVPNHRHLEQYRATRRD